MYGYNTAINLLSMGFITVVASVLVDGGTEAAMSDLRVSLNVSETINDQATEKNCSEVVAEGSSEVDELLLTTTGHLGEQTMLSSVVRACNLTNY